MIGFGLGFGKMKFNTVGGELVNNPTFAGATSWTLVAETSIANNKLTFANTTASRSVNNTRTAGIGRVYAMSITIDSISGGTGVRVNFGSIQGPLFTTPGTHTWTITATTTGVLVIQAPTAGTSAVISGISAKRLTIV